MKNLPLPPNNQTINHLTTALTYANGEAKYPLSQEEKDEISRLYGVYDQTLGQPSNELANIETLGEAVKNALYVAYSEVQQNKRLSHVRDSLMLAANLCPLCGIQRVTDLDHQLPHSTYKVFSIYVRNLVPVCHKCNNKKRTVAGVGAGERFAHVYFDKLPDERFLQAKAKIIQNSLIVDFDIVQTPQMSDDLFKSLRFQFGRLVLNERYQTEINVYLNSQITGFSDAYGPDSNQERLKNFISRTANSLRGIFGQNDWRTSVMHALSECDDFCGGGFVMALGRI